MDYKRTFYQICQPISDDIYLCTNFNNDSHILLSKEVYSLYINNTGLLTLQNNYPDIFNRLLSNNFLIKKEVDENHWYIFPDKMKLKIENCIIL